MYFKLILRRRRNANSLDNVNNILLSNPFHVLSEVGESEAELMSSNVMNKDKISSNDDVVDNSAEFFNISNVFDNTVFETNSENEPPCVLFDCNSGSPECQGSTNDLPDIYNDIKSYRAKFAKNVIIAHLNVNSLRNKFDEIKYILTNGYIDVLALSETKLDSSDNSNIFNVDGFTLLRKDKRKNSGGLIMYVSNRIPHRELNVNVNVTGNIEVMSIELIIDKGDKWFIGHIYKNPVTPNREFEDFLSQMSNQCLNGYDNTMLIGDMNFNMLSDHCLLKDLCDVYGYENVINSPTCFKSHTPTLIDVLLVTDKKRLFCGFSFDVGISDFHNLIGAALRKHIPGMKTKKVEYRKVKDVCYNQVRLDLFDLSLAEMINSTEDANAAFSKFHDSVISVFDKHAPVRTRIIKMNDFPIMNNELQSAIYQRNKYRNKFYQYRTTAYYTLYKAKRNNVTAIKRKLVRSYFLKRCTGGTNNKNFWKTIRPFFNKKPQHFADVTLREGDEIITDEDKLCNIFNDFFVSIGSDIGVKEDNDRPLVAILDTYKDHSSIAKINSLGLNKGAFIFTPINILDMKKAISKLNSKKACGFDGIPPSFIKTLKNDLAESMTVLVNKCIAQNVFPDNLKMSNISPVYKKKDKLNKDNYRSINLLPIVSKLFERVLNDQLYKYMNEHFHKLMSGFRKKHGCKDIMSKLTEDWRKALDNKNNIGVIAIDLSKAFDCMPHGLLLAKLYHYGIDVSTCELIKSYLCNRKQRVKMGSSYSPWVTANKGVPQGSILGPLLFNIFINDLLLLDMESTVYNYADDNTIVCIDKDMSVIKEKLQGDAMKAIAWFKDNMMKANPEKFQIMFLGRGTKNKNEYISLNDTKIYTTDSINILGLELDENLNFTKCIQSICSKVSKQINALIRIKNDLDMDSRKTIYNSYVVSNINYCCTVWMFTGRSNLRNLNKVNERALRMVYNDYSSDYKTLLCKHDNLDVYQMCLKALALEMFKIQNNLSPIYLKDLFVQNNPAYLFRDTNTYILPKFKTKRFGYHSMSYIGSKLWYDIDADIKHSDINCFKKRITPWLRDKDNLIEKYF